MKIFDISEVFQLAIRVEENGEKFYRAVAEKTENAKIKETFTYLADTEVTHKKMFEDMLLTMEKYEPTESYPGEYFEYLRAYADGVIFKEGKLAQEISNVQDVKSAIDFALRRELESIFYYQEMKRFVPKYQHHLLGKIIDEERKHFVDLSRLKENI